MPKIALESLGTPFFSIYVRNTTYFRTMFPTVLKLFISLQRNDMF